VRVKHPYDADSQESYTLILHSTMTRPPYSISDLAEEFAVTARTLRHYEAQGLIRPERKGLTRLYSNRDRARLRIALRASRLGFSIKEIRDLFHSYDAALAQESAVTHLLQGIGDWRERLADRQNDLDSLLTEMDFFAGRFKDPAGGVQKQQTQS
jgi:DNA-binding transcriptional MerR regulator